MSSSDWLARPVESATQPHLLPEVEAARRREREERRERERKQRRAERARVHPNEARWRRALRENVRAAILRIGKNARPVLNRFIACFSVLGDAPTYEPSQFPWTVELDGRWESISKEAERVLQARAHLPPLRRISPDHDRINTDDRWKVFFLRGYGHWQEQNCEHCPVTARLMKQVPDLETAFFSILEGGKHLPPHRGPTKAILTFHLGLIVPREREKCWIEIDKRLRASWRPGRMLVFDDTYKHEVLNDTNEDRVILLLHVRRPLRFPGNWIARAVLGAIRQSPFVRDGLRRHRDWYEGQERNEVPAPESRLDER